MNGKSTSKRALIALLCTAVLAISPSRCVASTSNAGSIVADVLLVRPFCLVGTIFGSAIFVISLPVAIPSRSVHSAARALVVKPAQATFTRPLGDVEELQDWSNDEY